jgi:hypothetical protein
MLVLVRGGLLGNTQESKTLNLNNENYKTQIAQNTNLTKTQRPKRLCFRMSVLLIFICALVPVLCVLIVLNLFRT